MKATKKSTKMVATKKAATKKAATKKAATKKMATKKAATKKAATKKASPAKATKKKTAKLSAQVTTPNAVAAHSMAPQLGQAVPNFDVPATGGKRVSLQGLTGKGIVLYFYPKDATPGCTIEGHEFTKLHEQFKQMGIEVYGVSRDDMNSHEKFKEKQCYSIDLLSDADGELCKLFDVIKMKNMYGRMVQGIERSTFFIDGTGTLKMEWRGVKAEGHAQQVLDFLKTQGA